VSHTPGPWKFRAPPASGDRDNPWVVLDHDSHVLAIVPRSPREANACLIAAAPELLDELAWVSGWLDRQDTVEPTDILSILLARSDHIRAAIAKAEGRHP
jgi:hypothetical protein